MKKMFIAMALALTAPSLLHAALTLDNSAWKATQSDKGDDTLVFIDGKFTSTACVPHGFYTGSYSTKKVGDATQWTATQSNKENDKMQWSGEISGNTMKGQFVHTDKAGKTWTQEWTATKMAE